MSFRLTLATLALVAPLAVCPALAQDAMHDPSSMSKTTMPASGMSHGAMMKHTVHAKMGMGTMAHGGTMTPAAGSAPHG